MFSIFNKQPDGPSQVQEDAGPARGGGCCGGGGHGHHDGGVGEEHRPESDVPSAAHDEPSASGSAPVAGDNHHHTHA